MQELTQIDTSSAHICKTPRLERWQVLEPVTGRWTWLTVFTCCSLVFEESLPLSEIAGLDLDEDQIQKAA